MNTTFNIVAPNAPAKKELLEGIKGVCYSQSFGVADGYHTTGTIELPDNLKLADLRWRSPVQHVEDLFDISGVVELQTVTVEEHSAVATFISGYWYVYSLVEMEEPSVSTEFITLKKVGHGYLSYVCGTTAPIEVWDADYREAHRFLSVDAAVKHINSADLPDSEEDGEVRVVCVSVVVTEEILCRN